jgi:hypothetical protein
MKKEMKLGKQNKALVLEMIAKDEFIKALTMREDMLVKMSLRLATGEEQRINTMFELVGLNVQAFMLNSAITKDHSNYQICLVMKDDRLVLMSVMSDEVYMMAPVPFTISKPRGIR